MTLSKSDLRIFFTSEKIQRTKFYFSVLLWKKNLDNTYTIEDKNWLALSFHVQIVINP
jgi:hypothetical protein